MLDVEFKVPHAAGVKGLEDRWIGTDNALRRVV